MSKLQPDWYLREWMEKLGKRQADFVKDLGWNPARISLMVRGMQAYTRDDIREIAAYLHLEPYELLMDPSRALNMRQLAEAARRYAGRVDE